MKILYIGVGLAAFLWFMMFSHFPEIAVIIHKQYFWYAMSFSTVLLSGFSLYTQRTDLKKIFHFEWKFVWIGIIHAVILYGMSRFGVYLFSHLFTQVIPQIESIYQTKSQLAPEVIAPLLFFLIAPAEEIFWRGFVQHKLMAKFGLTKGTVIGILLYSGVHIWALNPMLLLAALVLGIHWSMMYRRFNSIIPGIISHALWDTAIFVIAPVTFQ